MRALLPFVLFVATATGAASAAEPEADFTIGGERFVHADILDARAMPVFEGGATIMITFAPAAAKRVAAITKSHVSKTLPMILDGKLLVEPTVQAPLAGDVIEIASEFALPEAEALAKRISGKDPVPDSMDQ